MTSKRFFWSMIVAALSGLGVIAAFVIIVDPYFQYHAPYDNIHYRFTDERYVNSGIIKNFEYDAIVTGTSMTENFNTSEVDELFGVNSIKVPQEGASFKEINNIVELALEENPNVKLVIRAIDGSGLVEDKDNMEYAESEWPGYLYDDNYLNDINYVLSIDALEEALINCYMSVADVPSMTFDEYANWNDECVFSKDAVLELYNRPNATEERYQLTEDEREIVLENVQQNITAVAEEYPDVTFYYFIPPYSILYWDRLNQTGMVEWYIEAEKIAIEEMLKHSNIKVFAFSNCLEIVTELNYYKDIAHYWEHTNSNLLRRMSWSEDLLTTENYETYIESLYDIYINYDYESIFTTD